MPRGVPRNLLVARLSIAVLTVLVFAWVVSLYWQFSWYREGMCLLKLRSGNLYSDTLICLEANGVYMTGLYMSMRFCKPRFDWPRTLYGTCGKISILPLWPFILATALVSVVYWLPRRGYPVGHCASCGYDLRGNVSGRCSECGADDAQFDQTND